MTIVDVGLKLVGLYLALGFLFAVPFLIAGIRRIDPSARAGTVGFRLLVAPGVIALWPLLAKRWIAGSGEPPAEATSHKRAVRPGGAR